MEATTIWDRLAFGTVWHLGPSGIWDRLAFCRFFLHTHTGPLPHHSPTLPYPTGFFLHFFYIYNFFTFTTFLHLQLFYIYNFFTFTTFLHLHFFWLHALPGAMLYPVLCSTRCYALPGAMLYPVLCSTRCYALPGAQKSADFLRSALCINKKPFLFRPYLKALLLIHKCINGSFPGRL